ncbi:SH3 domain-containing protein [Xanthobacter versatilis]|uniref:SH3 domain-containing protein n=1 Tax=Xanthobacter autotrophicus (strain ATCC BAA-1158 / Py2) TaxID=78245 RepID=UPI00372A5FE5
MSGIRKAQGRTALLRITLASGLALWLSAPLAARAQEATVQEATVQEATWLAEAKAKLPATLVAGRIIRLDEEARKATIAVFPAGADSPAAPGSVFTPLQVMDVNLKSDNGTLAVAMTTVRPRRPDEASADDDSEPYQAELRAALAPRRKAEPQVEPCRIKGWALNDTRHSLAVRAAPSAQAKVVGHLAPVRVTPESGQGSEEGWRVEFDITGYSHGWFRIAKATPPGTPYGDPPPRRYPRTYAGTGWIRASEAGGAYANSQMPVRRLLSAPHVDAPGEPPGADVAGPDGALSIDGTLVRLFACSANWALTESRDGRRGWWRGICSNQVTNCS